MFTTRRYDDESGLYYYRFRMYDAQLGRFLQTDPIGYYDSMNLYQYCGNNPINFVDPWGLYVLDQYMGFIDRGSDRSNSRPRHQHPALPGQKGSRENPNTLTRNDLVATIRTSTMPKTVIGMLTFDPGGFYNRSAHYYTYNGKKHTGEEVNYIGVGAAAAHFGLPSGSLIPNLHNIIINHQMTPQNKQEFFDLGYEIYNELYRDK